MKFQDPPAGSAGRNGSKHAEIAAALRARPNEWALVQEGMRANSSAAVIKNARMSAYEPAGSFDATVRKTPDGKFDVYARFVGGAA